MREQQIEQNLAKAVKEAGGIAPKFTSPGFAGMPDRLVPVSYTHLDVYKRQPSTRLKRLSKLPTRRVRPS